MARTGGDASARCGMTHGDRAVFLGEGQRRGKHCDVLAVRGDLSAVAFDDIGGIWCMTAHLHVIPRRPRPDF